MEYDGVKNNCFNDVIKGSIMVFLVCFWFDCFYWFFCSWWDLIMKFRYVIGLCNVIYD